MITREEVIHIAKLAKMKLTEEEIEKFTKDLSGILDFFKDLEEVDTDGIEETSQVTGMTNRTRPDLVELCQYEDELLECSPHPIENHSLKIPKIM